MSVVCCLVPVVEDWCPIFRGHVVLVETYEVPVRGGLCEAAEWRIRVLKTENISEELVVEACVRAL